MKTILCTHTDLDGVGSWIVLDFFKIQYDEVLLCDYNRFDDEKEFANLLKFDKIIMTDYSVSNEIVLSLLAQGKKVTILDHHEGSEPLKEIQHENFILVHDKTKSGTLITYDYFKTTNTRVKKVFKDFIDRVDTYDLFKTETPLWEEALNTNRVLYGCLNWDADTPEQKYVWIKDFWFNKFETYDSWKWSDFELKKIKGAIDKENKQYIESKASMKKHTDSKGVMFGITVARSKVSIVAQRILKECQDIKYLIIINTYTNKWEKLSLRSRDENEINCNNFVECKGHACAAGGEVTQDFAAKLYKGLATLTYKE